MKTLALIPYYDGPARPDAAVGNCPESKRADYLHKTVNSLWGFTSVVVGVCAGTSLPDHLPSNVTSKALFTEPRFLPGALCRAVQTEAGLLEEFDAVYVTEADQVFHMTAGVEEALDHTNYLVPHRLEEVYLGHGADRGPVVPHDGKQFAICNGAPAGDSFYHPGGYVAGYGGAFLATRELFQRITFWDSATQPVEHVTGFFAYATGIALKTSDWERFFVEHLSGLDYHKSLA
jgi:hypothetical protein